MNKASKNFNTARKAKNAFVRICDTVNQQGTAGTIKSFCNAFLKGDKIELQSSYFSESTLNEMLNK